MPSGGHCDVVDAIGVLTDDVTDVLARIVIDISWIREGLGGPCQGDPICVEVEGRPDGVFQALRLLDLCDSIDGSVNPGLSNANRDIREQAKKSDNDDSNFFDVPTTPPPWPAPALCLACCRPATPTSTVFTPPGPPVTATSTGIPT